MERVGSDPICAGSLCLKVLHCNQSQSLTLTTLYRHTVKFCRIVDRWVVSRGRQIDAKPGAIDVFVVDCDYSIMM